MKSPLCSGLLVVVVASCGAKGDRDTPKAPPTIVLGDCVETPVALFVSGPRPVAIGDDLDPAASGDGDKPGGGSGDDMTSGSATGLGVIGTGRYGRPPGGTGDGYGISVGRQRLDGVPTVSIGQPAANGDLDKAIIRRYIKRNIAKITYCYEKELLAHPKLSGALATRFFIGPDGIVKSATAAGVSPTVATCVGDVIKGIEFPKPKGGGGVLVNYPFTFRYAGQEGVVAKAPKLPSLSTPGDTDPPPLLLEDPVPVKKPVLHSTEYTAGLDNPLAAIEGAMKDCLAKQPLAFGAFAVDLTFDAKHHVTGAKPVGLDAATATCIATAAKSLPPVKPGAVTLRCGVAFGDMPITDVPTIQITDKDITFDGKVVDHPKAVFLDASDAPRIAALGEALDAWVKPRAPTVDIVPVTGPGLLEAVDATPMRVVNRVIETTLASHADFVLASQTNKIWRPLRIVHVPVAPVPAGTGRAWSFIPNGTNKAAETVVLSVLVTQNQIWLGLSRINEFREIPGRDWDKLEANLKEHKASAFFADRIDLEIGAEDAVTYGDVVKVIEIAAKVGFTGWHVVPPARITATPAL